MPSTRNSGARPGRALGHVGITPDLRGGQDELASKTLTALNEIQSRMNGRITEGTGENLTKTGNTEGVWWEGSAPDTPDSDFVVVHRLGYLPKSVEVRWSDRAALVYASPANGPTTGNVTLRCNVASATLRLKIS